MVVTAYRRVREIGAGLGAALIGQEVFPGANSLQIQVFYNTLNKAY